MSEIDTDRFVFKETPLGGLWLVNRNIIDDARGYFSRFWCVEEFKAAGWEKPIIQINHTVTKKCGAIRGMHFQHPPYDEMKLVTCIRGEIFDAVADLRMGSPTFLETYTTILSSENNNSLLVPEGFAHGFQTLAEDCELMYLHTNLYSKESEGALNVMDPKLDIKWPLDISELSERDSSHPMLPDDYEGISI